MVDICQYFIYRKNYRQLFYNNKTWKEKSHQHLTVQQLFLYNILINIYSPAIMRSYDIQQSRKTMHLNRILIFRVVECNSPAGPLSCGENIIVFSPYLKTKDIVQSRKCPVCRLHLYIKEAVKISNSFKNIRVLFNL